MRLVVILSLLSTLSLGGIFFFQDGVLFERDVEDMWKIPEGVEVLSVDAEWWKVQKQELDWTDVLRNSKLTRCENPWDFGDMNLLSESPLILSNGEKCFYFLESPGIWVMFDCPKVSLGRFLRVPKTSKALIFSRGGWKAMYKLEDGEITFSAELATEVPLSGDFNLVSGRFGKRQEPIYRAEKVAAVAPVVVEKVSQRRIYHIGKLSVPSGRTVMRLFVGKPKEIDEIFLVVLPINSSTDWLKTRYTLVMENTKENGLGYPMPDGVVYAFEKGIPLGAFSLEGAQIGEKLKILENESEDVKVKLLVSSSKRRDGGVLRRLVLNLKNLSDKKVKVSVNLVGSKMELVESEIEPIEKAGDHMIFEIELSPGERRFELVIRSEY